MQPTNTEKQILEILKDLSSNIEFGNVLLDVSFRAGKMTRVEVTQTTKSIVLKD